MEVGASEKAASSVSGCALCEVASDDSATATCEGATEGTAVSIIWDHTTGFESPKASRKFLPRFLALNLPSAPA